MVLSKMVGRSIVTEINSYAIIGKEINVCFHRGYARRNPRKMVGMWTEKEMRNLKRLRASRVV